MKASVLLVTDDSTLVNSVEEAVIEVSDCDISVVPDIELAHSSLGQAHLHLIVVHIKAADDLPAVFSLLDIVALSGKNVATVVVSDQYDPEQALQLLRGGAADYLDRPISIGRLSFLIDSLTLRARCQQGPSEDAAPESCVHGVGEGSAFLYTADNEMAKTIEHAKSLAPLHTTILITGETGTGKNRLARLIHDLSPRCSEPFLVVDCAALTPSLVESEMFGHARGAFTGADSNHEGKFTAVGKGTLLIDEIDTLSLTTQAKLLRALDERVFEPVGSNKSLPLRARMIVASNRCLEEEVAEGRFRNDLYYRINVARFYLPPLRSRRGLIGPLVDQAIADFAAKELLAPPTVRKEALAALHAYDWPGNIRELRNVVERAAALNKGGVIQVSDLPSEVQQTAKPESLDEPAPNGKSRWSRTKAEAERNVLREALIRNANNRARTARELGISRVTLYKKLHEYGMI